jgi:hypothetical protein
VWEGIEAGYRRIVSEVPATAREIAKVLRSYLRDGRLATMPRPGRKRQIVMEHIVQRFEPGERYSEADVNLMLREFWDDVAALRRYLVEAGLLERADGRYWRIGGHVEV